jgi:PEGA domain-containing protein
MRARWMMTGLVAMAMNVGFATLAHAQAAAEYGVAAGHSATVTTGVAKNLSNVLNKSNEQTGSKRANIPQSAMTENRRQLETKAGAAPAKVHVESTPGKATILVDGVAVANTPADLKLPTGNHQIEIAHAGFSSWKKEVTLQGGDNPALKAPLESQYKSELKLSIQQ